MIEKMREDRSEIQSEYLYPTEGSFDDAREERKNWESYVFQKVRRNGI